MKDRLPGLEQYSRRNDVIISNVPTAIDENITNVVQKIGMLAGVDIADKDIDVCHRLRGNHQGRNIRILSFVF